MSLVSSTAAPSGAWPILLVCADEIRVAAVRRALAEWPVPVVLDVVTSAMPALRRVLAQPSRLVIVDWACDGPCGQALVQQLARLLPSLAVLAFDALGSQGQAGRVLAWAWEDLPIVLAVWRLNAVAQPIATGPLP